jgi:trehalose synthase
VRERFLLPRLITDELRLYASVLELGTVDDSRAAVGVRGQQRDPVCGMPIVDGRGRHLSFSGSDFYFCGASCEQQFAADPERFSRAT